MSNDKSVINSERKKKQYDNHKAVAPSTKHSIEQAINRNELETLRSLIMDSSKTIKLSLFDSPGFETLIFACKKNDDELIKFLIDNAPQTANEDFRKSMSRTMTRNRDKIVETLIENGLVSPDNFQELMKIYNINEKTLLVNVFSKYINSSYDKDISEDTSFGYFLNLVKIINEYIPEIYSINDINSIDDDVNVQMVAEELILNFCMNGNKNCLLALEKLISIENNKIELSEEFVEEYLTQIDPTDKDRLAYIKELLPILKKIDKGHYFDEEVDEELDECLYYQDIKNIDLDNINKKVDNFIEYSAAHGESDNLHKIDEIADEIVKNDIRFVISNKNDDNPNTTPKDKLNELDDHIMESHKTLEPTKMSLVKELIKAIIEKVKAILGTKIFSNVDQTLYTGSKYENDVKNVINAVDNINAVCNPSCDAIATKGNFSNKEIKTIKALAYCSQEENTSSKKDPNKIDAIFTNAAIFIKKTYKSNSYIESIKKAIIKDIKGSINYFQNFINSSDERRELYELKKNNNKRLVSHQESSVNDNDRKKPAILPTVQVNDKNLSR